MPEFYNRFQGRNDLMEYAKVRPDSAITRPSSTAPPGTSLQRLKAGAGIHAWGLNVSPGAFPQHLFPGLAPQN